MGRALYTVRRGIPPSGGLEEFLCYAWNGLIAKLQRFLKPAMPFVTSRQPGHNPSPHRRDIGPEWREATASMLITPVRFTGPNDNDYHYETLRCRYEVNDFE